MSASTPQPTQGLTARQLAALPGFVLVTFLAAVPGALWPPGDWYAALEKPA